MSGAEAMRAAGAETRKALERTYKSPEFPTLRAAVDALKPKGMLFSSVPDLWPIGGEDFERVVGVYSSAVRVGGDGVVRDFWDGSKICTLIFDTAPAQLAGEVPLANAPSLLDQIAKWERRK